MGLASDGKLKADSTTAECGYRRSVLLADESHTFQNIFRALFSSIDCDVLIANDGTSALELVGSRYVDFICAARSLRDMDGTRLCQQVRSLTQDVCKPFVLLTADHDDNFAKAALLAGVTDVFQRSELEQLAAYIRRFHVARPLLSGVILYVEDSPSQRAALSEILSGRGLTVDACASAEEAWEHFQAKPYDLVLTDIVLGGPLSGPALINRIRRLTDERGDVPVIAVTAFPDKAQRAKLSNLAVTDHILKPIVAEELLMRIHNSLSMRRYAQEISAQRAREHQLVLEQSKRDFLALFSNMPVGAALIDILRDERGDAIDYRLTTVNAAFFLHTGLNESVSGQLASDVFGAAPPPFLSELERVSRSKRAAKFDQPLESLARHFHIHAYCTDDNRLAVMFENITERKQAEDTISELAFNDQLTGLPNRLLLMDRIRQAMIASERSGRHNVLMLIDLDNFKTINDTHGHDIGDLLLKEVSARLALCVRPNDVIARLGGDEFVVILTELDEDEKTSAAIAETIGTKILRELTGTYKLGQYAHRGTASIGVSLFGATTQSAELLMKHADLAMYKAKDAGRNTLRFFDPAMEVAVKERTALEEDLRDAVLGMQFTLHYQAQVTDAHAITGAEVLLRWKHPERGMVSPIHFIPLAEQTGLILPIGHWVLRTACAQLARWAGDPQFSQLTLAVNVSARQFALPSFVEEVMALVEATGAPVKRLKLELTESLLLDNTEDIIAKMIQLKAYGVGFSMDDFGTGYSSLTYLKRLPIDQLKIDQSFVRDVLTDASDAAIARTIVALGRSLGLNVIAEGVETLAQRDFLAANDCRAYQGYLFSKPLPVEAFEALVRQGITSL